MRTRILSWIGFCLLGAVLLAVPGCLQITAGITPPVRPSATPRAPNTLPNTQWQLESFGPVGAEQPVIEGSIVTLEFKAGNQAGGSGGCNSYGAEYQVQGDKLTFSTIVSTERACIDERVTRQEQEYYQALQSASRFEITGDTLKIWYDNEQGVLNFARAASTSG